jgi:chromosome segregation ATPase
VDEALAARDAALADVSAQLSAHRTQLEAERHRIEQLEMACDGLCDRLVARERELAEVRAELGRLREEGDRGMRALAGLASELKDVRRQARG